ncbi:hypothetical protein Tco_1346341 [Tanacetum coccineum]
MKVNSKEKSKAISDLKVKEEKDIDKMIEMDKQLKFLNEIVYTRNQSIQTIHMLAPKCSTYNGLRTQPSNPRYLKKAQSEKPCLYEIPYDTSDLVNRFGPNREETKTLAREITMLVSFIKLKNLNVCTKAFETNMNLFTEEVIKKHLKSLPKTYTTTIPLELGFTTISNARQEQSLMIKETPLRNAKESLWKPSFDKPYVDIDNQKLNEFQHHQF